MHGDYLHTMNRYARNFSNVIDYKLGTIGAIFMGGIVYYINSDHGVFPAGIAAMKQAAYTFIIGGFILKILELIVTGIHQKALAYFCSVIAATIITVSLVFMVHSLKGTPKPFESTVPTIILAPLGYIYVARLKRNNRSLLASGSKSESS